MKTKKDGNMGDENFSQYLLKTCGKIWIFEANFLNFVEDMTICTKFRHFL